MAIQVRCDPSGTVEGDLDAAARILAEAGHAVALTGAGISVESGIPDFRSAGGLWEVFDPMEYATLSGFLRDPAKSWRFFRELGKLAIGRTPNPAHRALAQLESAGRLAGVVTQNVDGLHQAAGSGRVLEIHGNGTRLHCLGCGRVERLLPGHLEPGPAPLCSRCSRPLKPDVVLFEEPVRAMEAIRELLRGSDLLLVAGTSAEVTPAAWLPEEILARGGRLMEFNLEPTRLTRSGLGPGGAFVQGPVGTTLPLITSRVLSI